MKIRIGKRKDRISICSSKEDITSGSDVSISRKDIFSAWAEIKPKKSSSFTTEGYSIDYSDKVPTHIITINYNRKVSISNAAWIYNERLESPPRWFKIIAVNDYKDFWIFECGLVQNSAEALSPSSNPDPMTVLPPDSVRL